MQKDVFDLKIGKNIYQVDYDHKTGNFTSPLLLFKQVRKLYILYDQYFNRVASGIC